MGTPLQTNGGVPPAFLNCMLESYDTLCFSGGGPNGIAFIGCVKELLTSGEFSADRKPRHYIGTSVGALVACLMYCGFDVFAPETNHAVTEFCAAYSQMPTVESVFRAGGSGMSDGGQCVNFLRRMMQAKFGQRRVTFADLTARVEGTLTVVATNMQTAEPVYMSAATFPDEEVAQACFASMCLPGLFDWQVVRQRVGSAWVPRSEVLRFVLRGRTGRHKHADIVPGTRFTADGQECVVLDIGAEQDTGQGTGQGAVQGHIHANLVHVARTSAVHVVDGCFADNNPFSAAPEGARVLNLVLRRSKNFDATTHGMAKYAQRVMSLSMRRAEFLTDMLHSSVRRDIITVDTKGAVTSTTCTTPEDVAELLQRGIAAGREFLRKKYPGRQARRKTRAVAQVQAQGGSGMVDAGTQAAQGGTNDGKLLRPRPWTPVRSTLGDAVAPGTLAGMRQVGQGREGEGSADADDGAAAFLRAWSSLPRSEQAVLRALTALDPKLDALWRADPGTRDAQGKTAVRSIEGPSSASRASHASRASRVDHVNVMSDMAGAGGSRRRPAAGDREFDESSSEADDDVDSVTKAMYGAP